MRRFIGIEYVKDLYNVDSFKEIDQFDAFLQKLRPTKPFSISNECQAINSERWVFTIQYSPHHEHTPTSVWQSHIVWQHIHSHSRMHVRLTLWVSQPMNENSGFIEHRTELTELKKKKKISAQVAWSSQFWLKHWIVNTLFNFSLWFVAIQRPVILTTVTKFTVETRFNWINITENIVFNSFTVRIHSL